MGFKGPRQAAGLAQAPAQNRGLHAAPPEAHAEPQMRCRGAPELDAQTCKGRWRLWPSAGTLQGSS
jgi:hypothetical protein